MLLLLIQFWIASEFFFGQSRKFFEIDLTLTVPLTLELEHIINAQSAMRSSPRKMDLSFIQQSHEILAGNI